MLHDVQDQLPQRVSRITHFSCSNIGALLYFVLETQKKVARGRVLGLLFLHEKGVNCA